MLSHATELNKYQAWHCMHKQLLLPSQWLSVLLQQSSRTRRDYTFSQRWIVHPIRQTSNVVREKNRTSMQKLWELIHLLDDALLQQFNNPIGHHQPPPRSVWYSYLSNKERQPQPSWYNIDMYDSVTKGCIITHNTNGQYVIIVTIVTGRVYIYIHHHYVVRAVAVPWNVYIYDARREIYIHGMQQTSMTVCGNLVISYGGIASSVLRHHRSPTYTPYG